MRHSLAVLFPAVVQRCSEPTNGNPALRVFSFATENYSLHPSQFPPASTRITLVRNWCSRFSLRSPGAKQP